MLNCPKNTFSDADVSALKRIIEDGDRVPLYCQQELSGIWLRSEPTDDIETELRLLTLPNMKLTVSRVCFKNRRIGTMSRVFSFLKEFCIRENIPKIVIQAVETEEMARWCEKNGFHPDATASFQMNGVILGDYIFLI